uniref:Uncharacterized protein n=1 Tax=Ciona intestinalis TaxID=7719 RepID=F7AW62_CIOIN
MVITAYFLKFQVQQSCHTKYSLSINVVLTYRSSYSVSVLHLNYPPCAVIRCLYHKCSIDKLVNSFNMHIMVYFNV